MIKKPDTFFLANESNFIVTETIKPQRWLQDLILKLEKRCHLVLNNVREKMSGEPS
jgi:hypothetical protein